MAEIRANIRAPLWQYGLQISTQAPVVELVEARGASEAAMEQCSWDLNPL